MARSAWTLEPAVSWPRLVRASVWGMMSKASWAWVMAVTVRQQPLMAMESPSLGGSSGELNGLTSERRLPVGWGVRARTEAVWWMMPVNMGELSSLKRVRNARRWGGRRCFLRFSVCGSRRVRARLLPRPIR